MAGGGRGGCVSLRITLRNESVLGEWRRHIGRTVPSSWEKSLPRDLRGWFLGEMEDFSDQN